MASGPILFSADDAARALYQFNSIHAAIVNSGAEAAIGARLLEMCPADIRKEVLRGHEMRVRDHIRALAIVAFHALVGIITPGREGINLSISDEKVAQIRDMIIEVYGAGKLGDLPKTAKWIARRPGRLERITIAAHVYVERFTAIAGL